MDDCSRYFIIGADTAPLPPVSPDVAYRPSVCIDDERCPGAMFGCAGWFTQNCTGDTLVSHASDELHMFVGGDPDEHESLGATVEFQLENDRLVFDKTCFVFVPAGCAHAIRSVNGLQRPFIHYIMQPQAGRYIAEPAEATAPKGVYANNRVEKYAPVDGRIPEAPEGFLTFLLWIDSMKLAGAPYTEAVWFHTTNDTGPETHIHDRLDEFVAFIGSDSANPQKLNGDISFQLGSQQIHVTESCIVFVPRGFSHSPLLVHELNKDILHFSGGNDGGYKKSAI